MGIFSPEDLDKVFGVTPLAEPIDQGSVAEHARDVNQNNSEMTAVRVEEQVEHASLGGIRSRGRSSDFSRPRDIPHSQRFSKNTKIGALVVAGAVVGGLLASQIRSNEASSRANSPYNIVLPGNDYNQQSGGTIGSNSQPKQQGTVKFISPKDFRLSFVGFGPENQGYRQLGTYATNPAKFNFESNGHTFTVNVPAEGVDLLTGGNNIQSIINNNGVDNRSDTWKKLATINQESLDFKSSFSTPDFVDKGLVITTVLPAQQLAASGAGYTVGLACTAFPKLVGCPGVKVPSSYKLSSEQVKRYKSAAAIDMLLSVQSSCAKAEFGNEKLAIDYALDGQAKKQGIKNPSPGLITEEYVDSNGKPANATPNYVGRLVGLLLKEGGFDNVAQVEKLFADQPNITSVCQLDKIKPAV